MKCVIFSRAVVEGLLTGMAPETASVKSLLHRGRVVARKRQRGKMCWARFRRYCADKIVARVDVVVHAHERLFVEI